MLRSIIVIWIACSIVVGVLWYGLTNEPSYDDGWKACSIGTYPTRESQTRWVCNVNPPARYP